MSTANLYGLLSFTLVVGLLLAVIVAFAAPHNGFDLSNSLIEQDQILAGGPPRDGIPAINEPKFLPADKAVYLRDTDRILGIEIKGVSKAYPISILNWHEIVNDEIEETHFAITYCPLCGTGVAFSSEVDGKRLEFGVSGLLYNSDVLLYDRQSESLWSQIKSQAISGQFRGHRLTRLPITHTNWGDWKQSRPDTLVLSTQTGYSRDYTRNPYQGYEKSRALYFQVSNQAPDTYQPKERVLGLEIDNQFKAYPFSEIDKAGKQQINDRFAGEDITIHWDRENQSAYLSDANGQQLAAIEGFWFAWFAFHPQTDVFKFSKNL